jgi:Zn-dependent oligopeptidase
MFLDSIVGDPDWLTRYAKNAAGQPMPPELIKKSLREQHTFLAHYLRKLMIVPYFERALYEMSDAQLTAKNILETGRRIETQMVFQPSDSRPILSVPHLLASDSSAYYHAYVLAQMAVYQTRDFFRERDGQIMDNPRVGRDLREAYWKPGNSRTFLQFIEALTGKPFSAKATVALVNKSLDEMFAEADVVIEREKILSDDQGPVELAATIRMIHGDDVIASNEDATFEQMAETYEQWLHTQEQ